MSTTKIVQCTKITIDKDCTAYYYKNVQSTKERGENMKEIKSANDIIVVPVSYFNGMEKELQKILNKVDIHDMDVMEQVLHMRKWLKTKTVYEETKRLYPNLRLENIHLLLPQEEESSCECTDKTDSE